MDNLLTVAGVTKRFGNRLVLQDVGFSVRSGEVLGLIGPNGSGKTTLFECLAGLMPTNAGTIKANNKELTLSRRKEALFYLPDAISPWQSSRCAGFSVFSGNSTNVPYRTRPL
jgi:ABC-2 type transport system ATP-binding protein